MAEQLYTVKAGDTLSKIASQYGVNITDVSGYASGDPNKIGVGENLKIATRTPAPANTINATDLGQTQYKTPPVTPLTGYAGLIASSNAAITSLKPEVDKDKTNIESKYDRLGQLPGEKADAYKSEGVYDKQKTYNTLVNTINQKDFATQTRIDKIRNDNPTGQLSEGQRIAIDKIEKDWAIEKAALSISAAFAQDDYTLAKTIVDDRITAETEALTTELAGLQFFYSENKDSLSDERKNLLQFQIQQIEDEKAEKENLLSEIGAIQLAAAENGAPADVIVGIAKATDLTTAITKAGSWIDNTIDRDGSGGGGFDTVDLAPEDERTLTGAGFSVQDIKDLKLAVAEFGIDVVLSQITDPAQKAAVQKVYGIDAAQKVNRATIEASITNKMAVDALSDLYTEEELTQIARESGFKKWYQGKDKERSNFLASDKAKQYYVNQLIEQYKAAGMFEGE